MRAGLAPLLLLAVTAPSFAAEVNGYASSRSQYTQVKPDGLLPADDQAKYSELLEVNAQVRQQYLERAFVYGDVSLFGNFATGYEGLDADGNVVALDDRDAPASRPFISINELYVNHELFPELVLTAGKKRVVWGSGLAFNPTDLLNPAKDPTDPSLQRAGAWVAQVEVPLETMTFTLLASPKVTAQANGVPYRFLYYPAFDRQDDEAHWLLAARWYALWADSDLNLMLFYGNRDPDAFEDKLRVGASFSRNFANVNEVHLEALFQSGSTRSVVNGACVTDKLAAAKCALGKKPFVTTPGIDSSEVLPRILLGARRQFDDESMLSFEYLYQADGYTPDQLQDLVNAYSILRASTAAGLAGGASAFSQGSGDSGLATRFRFEPLGQHYLFASYQKPRIKDDFTAQITAIVSLQDLSTMWAPMLSWSTTEWLTLSASAFIPVAGPKSLAARDPEDGTYVSEYTLAPLHWRGLFEARVFY